MVEEANKTGELLELVEKIKKKREDLDREKKNLRQIEDDMRKARERARDRSSRD